MSTTPAATGRTRTKTATHRCSTLTRYICRARNKRSSRSRCRFIRYQIQHQTGANNPHQRIVVIHLPYSVSSKTPPPNNSSNNNVEPEKTPVVLPVTGTLFSPTVSGESPADARCNCVFTNCVAVNAAPAMAPTIAPTVPVVAVDVMPVLAASDVHTANVGVHT